MLISHEKEKLYNAIIYFLNNTKHCGKTKLMKLLYFLDFIHFKETGSSVTELEYFAWDFGPYPKDIGDKIDNKYEELLEYVSIEKENNFTVIKPKKKFDDLYFSKRELRILKDVAFIYKEAKTNDMIEITHLKNKPWDKTLKECGKYKKIDYFLSLDETSRYTKDEILNQIKDRNEIIKAFSW